MAAFFRSHRRQLFASSALMAPMSKAFVAAIDAFVAAHALPLISFEKGQRKDDVMAEHRARFTGDEGILFVGKAQEKAAVCRTEKRRNRPRRRRRLHRGRPARCRGVRDRRLRVNVLTVLPGNGDGTFGAPIETALPDAELVSCLATDLDGAGGLDVLVLFRTPCAG